MKSVGKFVLGVVVLTVGATALWAYGTSSGLVVHHTNKLPTAVQPVNDGSSPAANILVPTSCRLSGDTVTAEGKYDGLVTQDFYRVGDIVVLYVYTSPIWGYPQGTQLAILSQENVERVGWAQSWIVRAPLDLSLGHPARCAVTVQATHQFEGASNAY